MKPSHRKDVIIARIIFAFICLALLAIIVSIVVVIGSHFSQKDDKVKDTQIQTESESEDTNVYEDIPVVTPEQEVIEQKILVKTTDAVNLRSEASKESEVQAVIPKGTELIVISEEDGWAQVEYAGYSGYVFTEFIQQIVEEKPEEDEAANTVSTPAEGQQ